jgi:hypothetical protein
MSTPIPAITIPADLLPPTAGSAAGHRRSGPGRRRPPRPPSYLGTSTVRPWCSSLRPAQRPRRAVLAPRRLRGHPGQRRHGLWDALTFGLIDQRSQHLTFGEFSGKFATAAADAPWIGDPTVISSEVGTHPTAVAEAGIDTYALTHNETSTGVAMPLTRPAGADAGALVAVDATSAAGGLRFDPNQVDVYYFAPQKCLASDGGLWIAAVSPAAVERIERIAANDRFIPPRST